jgi:alpha-tubulin suppressor-like RCC1 family protein
MPGSAQVEVKLRWQLNKSMMPLATATFSTLLLSCGVQDAYILSPESTEATIQSVAIKINTNTPVLTRETTASFTIESDPTNQLAPPNKLLCGFDGGTEYSCVTPVSFRDLNDGQHSLRVTLVNSESGKTLSRDYFEWTVDTQPPVFSFTETPPSPHFESNATFSFLLVDASEIVTISCSIDNGDPTPCASPFFIALLLDGEHTFQVHFSDKAGNSGLSPLFSWTISTQPPLIIFTQTPSPYTSFTNATFDFTITNPPGISLQSTECNLDAGAWQSCTAPVVYTGLVAGSHVFNVRATSDSGISAIETYSWGIDNEPPVITLFSNPDSITAETFAAFSFTITDQSPILSTECSIDGSSFLACSTPNVIPILSSGDHTLMVRATDRAGNIGLLSPTFGWTINTGFVVADDPNMEIDSVVDVEGSILYFNVLMQKPSTAAVAFTWTATDLSATGNLDFTPILGSGTIPAGAVSKKVAVQLVSDGLPELIEHFKINLQSQSGQVSGWLPYGIGYIAEAAQVSLVSSSFNNTCALFLPSGMPKCWGANNGNQLGRPGGNNGELPEPINGIGSAVSQIATGNAHTCALTIGGDVYCWGNNSTGQIGDGTVTNRNNPTQVINVSNAIEISIGFQHSCALLSDGTVRCWGWNTSGQLGNGNNTNQTTPVQVSTITGVSHISTGQSHSCALLSDGSVKCWGLNANNQLGNGNTTNSNVPVSPNAFPNNVTSIDAGHNHNCAVLSDLSVYCWGMNDQGQIGNLTTTNQSSPVAVNNLTGASQVSAGDNFTCALLTNNLLKCWGANANGQLGNGSKYNSLYPISVNFDGQVPASISAGGRHVCAVMSDSQLFCWGSNTSGQLANYNSHINATPQFAGGFHGSASHLGGGPGTLHTCAVIGSVIRCRGENGSGQLGNGSKVNQNNAQEVINLTGTPKTVATGNGHTCASMTSGEVYCWGANGNGQLGNGNLVANITPVQVGNLGNVVKVETGNNHSCALINTGEVKCWGANANGQLGNGVSTDSSNPVKVKGLEEPVTALVAGTNSNCVIAASGKIQCWGNNGSGQLGNGSTNSVTSIPTDVLAIDHGATQVAIGDSHACALLDDKKIKCWGSNTYGELGVNPNSITIYDTPGNTVRPVLALGIENAKQITAGAGFSCALNESGAVYCWGYNSLASPIYGNTLLPATHIPQLVEGFDEPLTDIKAMKNFACGVNPSKRIQCWAGGNPNLETSAQKRPQKVIDATNQPEIFVQQTKVSEGSITQITVRLNKTSTAPVSFDWTTVDDSAIAGIDYISTSGTGVTIAAGSISTTLSVPTLEDNFGKPNPKFKIALSNFTNTHPFHIFNNSVQAKVSIIDNDPHEVKARGFHDILVNQCSPPIRLDIFNANEEPSILATNEQISFGGHGSGSFYQDANCTIPITTIDFTAGEQHHVVFFKSPSPANLTLTFTHGSLKSTSFPLKIKSLEPPAQILLTGINVVQPETCYSYDIELLDKESRPTFTTSALPIRLTVSSEANTLYLDSNCTNSAGGSLNIPAGSSNLHIYMKTSKKDSFIISASANGLSSSSLGIQTQAEAMYSQLIFTGPLTVTPNTCVAYNVYLRDSYGNAIGGQDYTIWLTTTLGGIYSNNICTTPASGIYYYQSKGSGTFYYKSGTGGPAYISGYEAWYFMYAGIPVLISDTATKLQITGNTSGATQSCESFSLNILDSTDQPTGLNKDLKVDLTSSGSGIFYNDSSCTTTMNSVWISAGETAQLIFYKPSQPGAHTLSASTSATQPLTAGTLNLNALNNRLVFSNANTALNPGTCQSYTIEVQDSANIPVLVGSDTLVNFAGVGSGSFYSASDCLSGATNSVSIVSGTSSAIVYYKNSTVGGVLFSVTGDGLGGTSLPVSIIGSPTQLTFYFPGPIQANDCNLVEIQTTNNLSIPMNVVGALTVNLSGIGNGGIFSDASCGTVASSVAIAAGTSSNTFYIKTKIREWFRLTASAGGYTTIDKNIFVSGRPLSKLRWIKAPAYAANLCSSVEIQTADDYQIPRETSADLTINLSSSSGARFYSDSNCVNEISFTSVPAHSDRSVFYIKASTSGPQSLTALASNSSIPAATESVVFSYEYEYIGIGAGRICGLANNDIWCWGLQAKGTLGSEQDPSYIAPVKISYFNKNAQRLAVGSYFNCVLLTTGEVECWGENNNGELGRGAVGVSSSYDYIPVNTVALAGQTTDIFAGPDSACALLNTGDLRCWGLNSNGQLGINNKTDTGLPTLVQGLLGPALKVAMGQNSTCALLNDGQIQCWGNNSSGQLGKGDIGGIDLTIAGPVVSGIINAVDIVGSGTTYCALLSDSTVKCWGNNANYGLGDGTTTSSGTPITPSNLGNNVASISVGYNSNCVIHKTGEITCWGKNTKGQLGVGNTTDITIPSNAPSGSAILTGGKKLYSSANSELNCTTLQNGLFHCWGNNSYSLISPSTSTSRPYKTPVKTLTTGVKKVAASMANDVHICVLTTAGGVKCIGENSSGQMGCGDYIDHFDQAFDVVGLTTGVKDIAIGYNSTCALLLDGTVQCWGSGNEAAIASWSSTDVPIAVPGVTGAVSIAGKANSFCAVGEFDTNTAGNEMYCWGYIEGLIDPITLSMNYDVPKLLSFPGGIKDASLGELYTCALTNLDEVWCTGDNSGGQLGFPYYATTPYGSTEWVEGFYRSPYLSYNKIKSLDGGMNMQCGITDNDDGFCIGIDYEGQVGDGSYLQTSNHPIPISNLFDFLDIQISWISTCGITKDKRAFCWGNNWNGQFGNSRFTRETLPVPLGGAANANTDIESLAIGGKSIFWVENGGLYGAGYTVVSGNTILDIKMQSTYTTPVLMRPIFDNGGD